MPDIQKRILERTGLYDDVDLLEELEMQWLEFINHERKKAEQKNKMKSKKAASRRPRRGRR